MSRVIGYREPRPFGRGFLLVGPVVSVGVDVVVGDRVVARFADHGDGAGGDQDEDGCAGVAASDAQVMQSAAEPQGF